MPKYRPETAKLRAKSLIKPYIRNNFSQVKTARELGVSQPAIAQRLKQKPVRDLLQKFLDSEKLEKALIEVGIDGLKANKVISCNVVAPDGEGMKDANSMTKDFVDVPDHQSRHRFWHDLLVAKGKLKTNGNGDGVSVVNIVYAYRKPAEDKCLQR
jgi:predicted transcriptional regulator